MTEQFYSWDSAEYLDTEEDVRLYLEACIEEDPGDGSLIRHALGTIAKARGITSLAEETGLTRAGLYKALGSDGNPSFTTVLRVVQALGCKLTVVQRG